MVELLKQPQYAPMNVVDQIFSIYAGTRGHLDKIPNDQVETWEAEFLKFIHDQKNEVWQLVRDADDLDDKTVEAIEAAITEFQAQFATRHKADEPVATA